MYKPGDTCIRGYVLAKPEDFYYHKNGNRRYKKCQLKQSTDYYYRKGHVGRNKKKGACHI